MQFDIIEYIAKTKQKHTHRVHAYTIKCKLDYCAGTFKVHDFMIYSIKIHLEFPQNSRYGNMPPHDFYMSFILIACDKVNRVQFFLQISVRLQM